MTDVLEVNSVVKKHGSFTALKGVSFKLEEGQIISILGPSGCGKSTLLQLVAGLDAPNDGEIRLRGQTVAAPGRFVAPEKRGINMVFQDYALWPHMTVYDNIAYGLRRKRMSAQEQRKEIGELLDLLQLQGLEGRFPPQLSGGQQQRVAIARALATRPSLLLMDEPLSNLDMRLRIDMRTEMSYLFRQLGISVLHVTHDPSEAFSLADRLMIMRSGQVDQLDEPEACYRKPASRWAASLLGATNVLQGMITYVDSEPCVRIGSVTFQYAFANETVPLHESSGVEVMIRPEDITLTEGLQTSGSASSNRLTLSVIHCAFEGNQWRLLVKTEDGQRLSVLHSSRVSIGAELHAEIPVALTFVYALDTKES